MKQSRATPKRRAWCKPVLIAGLWWTALGAQAATYTVTGLGEPDDPASASCPSNSCPTLRDSINAALANTNDASNTIRFDPLLSGQTISLTQYSNDTGNPNNGEFGPSAFYLPSSLTPSSTLTIDATLNGVTSPITIQRDPSAPKFRLFDVGVNATLTLRGLVLAHGVAKGGSGYFGGAALGAGGAVFSQGTVLLDRCLVSGNQALGGDNPGSNVWGGGGVGGSSDVSGNGGGPNGGAAGPYFGFGNGDPGGFGGGGGSRGTSGGIGGNGGFGGGNAAIGGGGNGGFGGGFGSFGSGGGMGGGVFNDAGSLTLTNSTFTNNLARGGHCNQYGNATCNGLGFGGAVFNYSGTLVLNGVTLSGNSVTNGNSVTSGSTAGGQTGSDGGAIYSLADGKCGEGGNICTTGGNASLSMFNSVAVNNTGTGNSAHNDVALNVIPIPVTSGSPTSTVLASGNNAIGVQSPAGAVAASVTSDFMLGSLSNNVFAPQPGSPLIDAGHCSLGDGLIVDQLGTSRPQGAACDIGAVEVQAPVLNPVGLSDTTTNATTLKATSDIAATGYWMVVPTDTTEPTATEIETPANYSSASVVASGNASMGAGTPTPFAISGLSPGVTYDLYLVATSANGGTSVVSSLKGWKTLPQTVSGPVPNDSSSIVTASLSGPAGCGIASYSFDPLPTGASAPPPGFSLPYGAFQFTTNAQCSGGAVSFTLSYPEAVSANAQYHKFGPTPTNESPAWYAMPGISISGNSVTFQITDGQLGDDDLTANGVIVDGGGLTVPLPVDVNAIPALGEWALALLAVLMGGLGLGWSRRGVERPH